MGEVIKMHEKKKGTVQVYECNCGSQSFKFESYPDSVGVVVICDKCGTLHWNLAVTVLL